MVWKKRRYGFGTKTLFPTGGKVRECNEFGLLYRTGEVTIPVPTV